MFVQSRQNYIENKLLKTSHDDLIKQVQELEKALELACKLVTTSPYDHGCWKRFFLKEAREQLEG